MCDWAPHIYLSIVAKCNFEHAGCEVCYGRDGWFKNVLRRSSLFEVKEYVVPGCNAVQCRETPELGTDILPSFQGRIISQERILHKQAESWVYLTYCLTPKIEAIGTYETSGALPELNCIATQKSLLWESETQDLLKFDRNIISEFSN
jgi:hypothetical protein